MCLNLSFLKTCSLQWKATMILDLILNRILASSGSQLKSVKSFWMIVSKGETSSYMSDRRRFRVFKPVEPPIDPRGLPRKKKESAEVKALKRLYRVAVEPQKFKKDEGEDGSTADEGEVSSGEDFIWNEESDSSEGEDDEEMMTDDVGY